MLYKIVSRVMKQSQSNANKIFNRVCRRKKCFTKMSDLSYEKEKNAKQLDWDENM